MLGGVRKICERFIAPVWAVLASIPIQGHRWAKGPIDRYSDTDSIFRLYRSIQSVDFKFRFLYRAIVSVHFSSNSFIDRSCFLGLSSDFCIGRLCRPVWSKKSVYRYFNLETYFVSGHASPKCYYLDCSSLPLQPPPPHLVECICIQPSQIYVWVCTSMC